MKKFTDVMYQLFLMLFTFFLIVVKAYAISFLWTWTGVKLFALPALSTINILSIMAALFAIYETNRSKKYKETDIEYVISYFIFAPICFGLCYLLTHYW